MKKLPLPQAAVAILALPIIFLFWSTSSTSAAGPTIRPGTTINFAVLASSTITNTGATTVSGTAGADIGLSPGTSFTNTGSFSTSGSQHITDSAASTAQTDFTNAYNDLGVPTPTTLGNPDLAGQTISPGTYKTAAGTFSNSGILTLDAGNDPTAIFIFQAASTVITSTSSTMSLTNGAQACNVYWQVGSSATLGVTSSFIGKIYAAVSITANTGATIKGQLLAHTGAVTLDHNTIINDNCVTSTPTPTPTPTPRPVCTTTISNLQFASGGPGATTGKLTWNAGDGLFQFVGDPSLYPAPFNYGTRTALWNGSLVSMVPSVSYPVTVNFFATCGLSSQASIVISNAAAVATPTPTPTPTPVATPTPTPTPVATPTPTPTPVATPKPTTKPTPVKTVTGGELPKTGAPWFNLLALAAGSIMVGSLGVYLRKPRNS